VARVAGAVLAAGSGERMGLPKAGLVVDGTRLVDRAVAALRDGGCSPVIAVVPAGVDVDGARVIVNPDPRRGMRSSLELAVDAAAIGPEIDALAVLLVDTPGVGASCVRAVRDGWLPGRIAVAGYPSGRGHPTVMPLELWRAALSLAGPDEGAKALLAAQPDRIDVIAIAGDPTDLDTAADLASWIARRDPRGRA